MFADLSGQREALRGQIIELENKISFCRAQFKTVIDSVDALAGKPADVISEPAPRQRWSGPEQDQPTGPCQGATPQPVLSKDEFMALRRYNYDFSRRPARQRFVYRPPFPVGRMQIGMFEPPVVDPPISCFGQQILCLHGGEVPLAASAMARRIELHTGVAQAADADEALYPQAAQLCQRREQVGRLIVDNLRRFSDIVDAIRLRELQSVRLGSPARPPGGL